MVRTALSISLLVSLANSALAANDPDEDKAPKRFSMAAVAANTPRYDKTPSLNALPVSGLLERAAKSSLGPTEAGLLRAVADLVDKEQAAVDRVSPAADANSVIAAEPAPLAVPAARSTSARMVPPPDQRKRLVFRLRNAPVVDVAKAIEDFLDCERKVRRYENNANPNRAVLVPEPLSNSLLISGTPETVASLTELIAELDADPDMVMVEVCIAEQLPPSRDGQADDEDSDDATMESAPHMEEDGAAWLAWAKTHGRLDVLSRPQVITLDNQPAFIYVGRRVPTSGPKPGTDAPAKGNQIEQAEVGLSVGLTPRISPEGLVVMELDVERTEVIDGHRAAGPIIGKTSAQTIISAKDGETVVLGGLIHRTEDGQGSLIIAVTPRVNPKR